MMCSKAIVRFAFLTSLLVLSRLLPAQSIMVIGGDASVRNCYLNASSELNLLEPSARLLEPCDYALAHVPLSQRDIAAIHSNRGIILAALGRYTEALVDYERSIALIPDKAENFINRGNLYFYLGAFADAIQDYSHALTLSATLSHIALTNRGISHEQREELDAALADYLAALELMPGWPAAEERRVRVSEKIRASQNKRAE
ncbi:MAG: tetratricopeptide repeat protein [Pseudomonadales bacterium]|nr:tetratricopeptide repeat protein [Pseudomonadales bacterium]